MNQNNPDLNKAQNVNANQAQVSSVSQTTPDQGVQSTILLIEDDPVLSRMYKEKFKNEGFNVLVAQDGEAGLKMALEEKVGVILLDIMLPKLSGTDLLAKLRQDPQRKNTPVVALTNLAEAKEKEAALQLGVKEYLIKAMQTPEQVVEKVKKYITR